MGTCSSSTAGEKRRLSSPSDPSAAQVDAAPKPKTSSAAPAASSSNPAKQAKAKASANPAPTPASLPTEAETPGPSTAQESPKAKQQQDDEEDAQDPAAEEPAAARAQRQRRRLSLKPGLVGDVEGVLDGKQQRRRRGSFVEAPEGVHLGDQPEPEGANKAEEFHDGLRHVAITRKGFVPYNRTKRNQDTYIVAEDLLGDGKVELYGVCDGHGECGHHVAAFVRDHLPAALRQLGAAVLTDTEHAMKAAVESVVHQLDRAQINVSFSGTTLVFSLKIGRVLWTGNVGDSRCVVGRRAAAEPSGVLAVPLTVDQKPDDPVEKARILAAGGRVQPLKGPPGEDMGPPRVWLGHADVPGLAMSRSIGDAISHTVGVVSEPIVTRHEITGKDAFAVWATDGVWEFLSSQEVADIVHGEWKDFRRAAKSMVQESVHRWKAEEDVIDDITGVVVRFTPPQQAQPAAAANGG